MYRKILIIFLVAMVLFGAGCKQQTQQKAAEENTGNTKKEITEKEKKEEKNTVYAKYRVNIYKDKNLNSWLATLAKGENVKLLDEFEHKVNNKNLILAKIVRADGETEGFIERRHLAGKPIIFAKNDVEIYDQPTITSNLYTKVKKGTVGFILEEKGEWTKIFIGYVEKDDEKKYVNEKWVKGGYSTDIDQIKNGLLYERAMNKLNDDDKSNDKDAVNTLEELSEKQTLISGLAEEKLLEYEEPTLD